MRIVGGKFRGRALVTPSTNAIRPTTDRTRESLFNILAHSFPDKVEGVRVLDLLRVRARWGWKPCRVARAMQPL